MPDKQSHYKYPSNVLSHARILAVDFEICILIKIKRAEMLYLMCFQLFSNVILTLFSSTGLYLFSAVSFLIYVTLSWLISPSFSCKAGMPDFTNIELIHIGSN